MKSIALSLSKISPEFLIYQNRFLPDLSYTFSQYLITCFLTAVRHEVNNLEIVSEYDQEIPQSQTADTPWHREEEPLNHHETPGRQIKQSNQLSLPYQDDCNTRMDIK